MVKKVHWFNDDLMATIKSFVNRCQARELNAVHYNVTFEDMHNLLYPPDMREIMKAACGFSSKSAQGGLVSFADDKPGNMKCLVRMIERVACPSGFPCPIIPEESRWKNGAYDEWGTDVQLKIAAAYYAIKDIKMAWRDVKNTLSELNMLCESMKEARSLWPAIVPLLDKFSPGTANPIREYKPVKSAHQWTGDQIAMFKRANYVMMTGFLHPDELVRMAPRAVEIDADDA